MDPTVASEAGEPAEQQNKRRAKSERNEQGSLVPKEGLSVGGSERTKEVNVESHHKLIPESACTRKRKEEGKTSA